MEFWSQVWSDKDHEFHEYKKRGVGRGHSNAGQRRRWTKHWYFEQDLLNVFQKTMSPTKFTSTFAGYTPEQIIWFFNKIKMNAMRPNETECHCRNKLLVWLDKLHNELGYQQIPIKCPIGVSTAVSHNNNIVKEILKSFQKKNVIRFPDANQREKMVKILKAKGVEMPDAVASMDGSHVKCRGKSKKERLSYKSKSTVACCNVSFIVERVFHTICAFNNDANARKHDITVLRESWFYEYLDEIMDGWIILADKGYLGVRQDGVKCIAAILRRNMKGRKAFSKEFWHKMSVARSEVERTFSHFFWNKFRQLGNWPGIKENTFIEFGANLTCCVILYNSIKVQFEQSPLI